MSTLHPMTVWECETAASEISQPGRGTQAVLTPIQLLSIQAAYDGYVRGVSVHTAYNRASNTDPHTIIPPRSNGPQTQEARLVHGIPWYTLYLCAINSIGNIHQTRIISIVVQHTITTSSPLVSSYDRTIAITFYTILQ